jgi:alpha-beta hydrolase superfamily lysophospholipase
MTLRTAGFKQFADDPSLVAASLEKTRMPCRPPHNWKPPASLFPVNACRLHGEQFRKKTRKRVPNESSQFTRVTHKTSNPLPVTAAQGTARTNTATMPIRIFCGSDKTVCPKNPINLPTRSTHAEQLMEPATSKHAHNQSSPRIMVDASEDRQF